MDNQFVTNENSEYPLINSQSAEYLKESAKWASILAVFGFIGSAIMFVFAIYMVYLTGGGSSILMGFIYLLGILFYVSLSYYLYVYADKMKEALKTTNSQSLVIGFRNLKDLFRLIAIITIIGVVLNILVVVFGGLMLGM